MSADQKVLSALLRFGVDARSIGEVRAGALSVEDALKKVEVQAEKSDSKAARLKQTFDTFDKAGMGLSRLGMSLREFGDFLGSDSLSKTGQLVTGVGQLAGSVNDLYRAAQSLKGLGGLAGVLGPIGVILATAAATKTIGDGVTRALGGATSDDKVAALQRIAGRVNQLPEGQRAGKVAEISQAVNGMSEAEATKKLNELADSMGNVADYAAQANGSLFKFIGDSLSKSVDAVKKSVADQARIRTDSVQAYVDYQKTETEAETTHQQKRREIVAASLSQQLTDIATFADDEKKQRRDFDRGELKTRADYLRNEGQVAEDARRNESQIAEAAQRNESQLIAAEQRSRAAALKSFEESETRTEADYQRQRAQSLADYNRQRDNAEGDHARNEQKIGDERGKQRVKDLAGFAKSELDYEAQYYANRVKRAAAFGLDVQRTEEDHRLQMLRAAQDFGDSLSDLQDQRDAFGLIKAQREYNKTRERNEQDYQISAGRRNADYAAELVDQETQFRAQRDARQADFDLRLQEQDAAFAEQDADRKADWDRSRTEQQAEFDLQRDVQQAEFDRSAAQRKADFETQADERKAEFDRQAGERKAEFDRQAGERKAEFDRQAGERKTEFNRQAGERKAEFDAAAGVRLLAFTAELEQREQNRQDQLSALDTQFADEKAKREADFKDRLNQIDDHLTGEHDKRAAYYKLMGQDLDTYLGGLRVKMSAAFQFPLTGNWPAMQGPTAAPGVRGVGEGQFGGYAAGGYLGRGLFSGGERGYEFVLNHETTREAEALAGRRLDQDALLGLMAGRGVAAETAGGSGGGQWTLNQNFSFSGSFSESERVWFKQTAHDQAVAAIDQVIDGRRPS